VYLEGPPQTIARHLVCYRPLNVNVAITWFPFSEKGTALVVNNFVLTAFSVCGIISELTETTTATVKSLNKRFNKENNGFARAL